MMLLLVGLSALFGALIGSAVTLHVVRRSIEQTRLPTLPDLEFTEEQTTNNK